MTPITMVYDSQITVVTIVFYEVSKPANITTVPTFCILCMDICIYIILDYTYNYPYWQNKCNTYSQLEFVILWFVTDSWC